MLIPVNMDERVPEEATDFSRGPSGDKRRACARERAPERRGEGREGGEGGEGREGGEGGEERKENEIDLSMCIYECVTLGHQHTGTINTYGISYRDILMVLICLFCSPRMCVWIYLWYRCVYSVRETHICVFVDIYLWYRYVYSV